MSPFQYEAYWIVVALAVVLVEWFGVKNQKAGWRSENLFMKHWKQGEIHEKSTDCSKYGRGLLTKGEVYYMLNCGCRLLSSLSSSDRSFIFSKLLIWLLNVSRREVTERFGARWQSWINVDSSSCSWWSGSPKAGCVTQLARCTVLTVLHYSEYLHRHRDRDWECRYHRRRWDWKDWAQVQ